MATKALRFFDDLAVQRLIRAIEGREPYFKVFRCPLIGRTDLDGVGTGLGETSVFCGEPGVRSLPRKQSAYEAIIRKETER